MPALARPRGFTLIEAAVAILVVAVLAGALAPLAVKALHQQREARTREHLKLAFEACFGARDRRVANARADFGFNPGVSLANLGILVSKAGSGGGWAAVPDYGQTAQGLFWGWNGPYWQQSVDGAGLPADGWGRPLSLRWVTTATPNGWQVFSLGADGLDNTGAAATPAGDDLAYPLVPAPPLAFTAVLNVVVSNPSGRTGTIVLQHRTGAATLQAVASPNGTLLTAATPQTFAYNPIAGGVLLTITRSSGAPLTLTYTLDLLPGETRQFDVTI